MPPSCVPYVKGKYDMRYSFGFLFNLDLGGGGDCRLPAPPPPVGAPLWTGFIWVGVADACEPSNDPSGYVNCREFLGQLGNF